MANDVARLYLATDFLDNYKEISSKLKKMTKNLAQEADIDLGVNIDDKEIKQALDSINKILAKKDFQQLDISNVVGEFFGKLANADLGLEEKKKEIINFQRFLKNLSPTLIGELSHLGVEETQKAMKQIYEVFSKGGDNIFTQTGSFKKEGKWAKAEVDAIINSFSEEFNKRTRAKALIDNIDLFPDLFGEKDFKKVEKYAEDIDEIILQALRSFKKYENELSNSSLVDTVGFFKMYEVLTEDKDFTFFKNAIADEEKMSQELKDLKTVIIEILGLDHKLTFTELFEENILPEIKQSYEDTYVKGMIKNVEKFGEILKGERARILANEQDFQKKIEENNEKIQKDIKETEPEQKVNYTDSKKIKEEIDILEQLRKKIKEVETALNNKTNAIVAEEEQMTQSVNNEITKIEELIGKVEELRTKLMEDFKIVVNADFEELKGIDFQSILKNISLGNFQQVSNGVHSIADMLEQIKEANNLILNYSSFDDRTSIIGKTRARFANDRNLKEKHVAFNTQTGKYTNPLVYDSSGMFGGDFIKALYKNGKYDSALHTHPDYVATPSTSDFKVFLGSYKNSDILHQYILALDEVFEFDLQKFFEEANTKDLENIQTLMDEAKKNEDYKKYDIYNKTTTNGLQIFERLKQGTKANKYNWDTLKNDFKRISISDNKMEQLLGKDYNQKFSDKFIDFLMNQLSQGHGDFGNLIETGSLKPNSKAWKESFINLFSNFLEKNNYKGDLESVASSLYSTKGGRLISQIIQQTNEELKLENEGKNFQLALREMEKDIISNYFTDHGIKLTAEDVYKNYSYEDFFKAHPEFNTEIEKDKAEVGIDIKEDSIQQIIGKIHDKLKEETFSIEVTDVTFSEEAKTNISDFIKNNSENEPITLEKIDISQETISSILETLKAGLSKEPIYLNIVFNNPEENTQTSILKKTDLTKQFVNKEGFTSTGKNIKELNDVLNLIDTLQKTNEYSFYDKPDRIVANVGANTDALKDKYKQYIEYYESIMRLREILTKQKFPKQVIDSIYKGIEPRSLLDTSIDELKDQIKEYKEEYLKLFDIKNNIQEEKPTDTKIDDFQEEITNLEGLRKKYIEITSAINEKTELSRIDTAQFLINIDNQIQALTNLQNKINELTNDYSKLSVLTDKGGNPLTVYRGIFEAYEAWDSKKYSGAYGSTNPEVAREYATDTQDENWKIHQYNIKAKNPLYLDGKNGNWRAIKIEQDVIASDVQRQLDALNAQLKEKQNQIQSFLNSFTNKKYEFAFNGFKNLETNTYTDLQQILAENNIDKKMAEQIQSVINEYIKYYNDIGKQIAQKRKAILHKGTYNTDQIADFIRNSGYYDAAIIDNISDSKDHIIASDVVTLNKNQISNESIYDASSYQKDIINNESKNLEQEVSALEQLKQKIVDVTTAISNKNEAIVEEQQKMETAVTGEIEQLDKLEGKINSLPTSIEIPVEITNTENVISKENSSDFSILTDLKEKIDKITESIEVKTSAIIAEKQTMEDSVSMEVLALDNLQQSLEGIINLLSKSYDLKINIPEIDLSKLTSSLDNIQESVNTGNYTGFVTPLNDILKMIQQAEVAQDDFYRKEAGSGYFEHNHERGFLFNTKTGQYSNPFVAGQHSSIATKQLAKEAGANFSDYNAVWHSHPEIVATLSSADIANAIKDYFDYGFTKKYAQATREIAEFDAEGFIKSYFPNTSADKIVQTISPFIKPDYFGEVKEASKELTSHLSSFLNNFEYKHYDYHDSNGIKKNVIDNLFKDISKVGNTPFRIKDKWRGDTSIAHIIERAVKDTIEPRIDTKFKWDYVNENLKDKSFLEKTSMFTDIINNDINNTFQKSLDVIINSIIGRIREIGEIQQNGYSKSIINKDTGEIIEINSDMSYKELEKNIKEIITYSFNTRKKVGMDIIDEFLNTSYTLLNNDEKDILVKDIFQTALRNAQIKEFKNAGYDDIEDFYKVYSIDDFIKSHPEYSGNIPTMSNVTQGKITAQYNTNNEEILNEQKNLEILKEKIDEIRQAVELKTNAFTEENENVQSIAFDEASALESVKTQLEEIATILSQDYELKIKLPEISTEQISNLLNNVNQNVQSGNYSNAGMSLEQVMRMIQEAEKIQDDFYQTKGKSPFQENHERGFLFNTKTGQYSNPFIAGEHDGIYTVSLAKKTANMDINNYNASWHSHPENVAALSTGDIKSIFHERAFQNFDESFKYAQAVKEIAEFSAENFLKEFNKVHNLPIDSKPSSKLVYSIIEQAMTELDNENNLLSLDDLMEDISLSQLFDKYAPYDHRFESLKKVPSGDYEKLLSHIEISPNTTSSSDDLDFVSQQLEKNDIFTIKKEIQEYWANQISASTSSFIDIFENLAQDPNYEKSNFSEIALDALKQQQQEINDIILSNPEELIDNAIRKFEDDFLDEQISLTSKSMGTTVSLDDDKDTFKLLMEGYLQNCFFKYVDDITTQDLDKLLFKTYNGGLYEDITHDASQFNYRSTMQAFFRDKGYDVDKFYKVYTLDDFFTQNPQLARPPVTSTQTSTQESVEGLNNENQSFKDIALSAMTAAQAKEAFVEANKEVKASIEGSIDNIENEGKAFGSIDENTVSNIERITTAIEELNSMLEALNKLMRSVFSNQGQMGWDINENGILNLSKALNSIRSASTGNYYGGSTSNYYGIEEDQLRDLLDQYTRSLQDAITGFSGLNNVDFNNLIIALSEIYELLEKITENLNSGISTTQFDLLAEKIATYNPQIQEYNDKLEKAKKLAEEIAQIEGQWDSFYGDENWKDTSKIKPTTSILLEDSKSMGYEGLGQDLYSFIDSQIDSSNLIKRQKEQIENAKKIGNELVGLYNEYSKLSFKKIKNGGFLDSFDSQKLAEASQRIQDLKKQLLDLRNSLKPSDRTDIDNILKGVDEYERKTKSSRAASLYDTLINSEGDIQKLLAKRAYTTNTDVGNTSGLTVNEQNELLRLTEKRKQIQDEINKLVSEQGVKTQAVKQKEAELLQTQRSFENTLNQSWQNKLGDELQKPYDVISDLEYKSGDARYVQSDAFNERIKNLKEQADALRDSLKSLSYNDKDGIAKYNEQLLDLQRNITKAKDELKQLESKDVSKLMRNIAQFMERNSGISLQAKNELEAFYNELNDGARMSKDRLIEIANGFTRIQAEESKAGRTGMTFFDLVSLRGKALLAQLATFTSFYDFIRYFKEGMQIVIQFDTALAEMQKVSNESLETLRDFQSESFDLAGTIGSDALALQQSVAEFMRLGQSLEEATDSAMSANILLNVSEFTNASDASQALIAMSQAYQDLSNIEIIDVINKLGNDFPISTQGLATALQDGAASLTTAGNSFYEAAALVTAGNRIVQDPSKVGKAMRTIALRLTGTSASKAELEEDGEEVEGMITNVSKLRDVIMQATKVSSNNFKGFDILKDNGAYKSTYEILLGIAEIYDEIVENDKKTGAKGANLLLETIAGKNRASVAASILQSPDMLKEAYAEAIDAEGSAEIENAKFIDSISGHLEKLKNAWQELWANVATREFVNNIIDFGTAILKAVNSLGLLKSAFITLSTLDIFKFLLKGGGFTGSLVNSINQVIDATKKVIPEEEELPSWDVAKTMVKVIRGTNIGEVLSKEAADEIIKEGSGEIFEYAVVEPAKKAMDEAGKKGGKTFLSSFTSEITSKGLGKAMSEGSAEIATNATNFGHAILGIVKPLGIIAGIIGAIAITLKAIDVNNLIPSETAKEAKEIVSSFQETQKNIKAHQQTIDELSVSYTKLSKSVNTSTNANLTLSNEEYQEYLNVCNQIADIYPELVMGYDSQGNAILRLKGNVDELTESLIKEKEVAADALIHGGLDKEQQKSPLQRFLHWGDDKSVQKDFENNYEDYEAYQEVRDYFKNLKNPTLEDYNKYRQDLIKEIQANSTGDDEYVHVDEHASRLLRQLNILSNDKIASNEQDFAKFLYNITSTETPEYLQQSLINAQTQLQAYLDRNKTYQDLIYRSDSEIRNTASGLFTNIINSLSPEQLNELYEDEQSMENYTNSLVDTLNKLFSETSKNPISWSDILNDKELKETVNNYSTSINTLKSLGYSDKDIATMVDSGKVGNVNLKTDRTIQWNEDNLNKYISQLRGWNEGLSDEDIINQFKNKTSTVLGSADTFNFGEGTIDLSFSIISEDGRLYDIDELYNYINDVLKKAEESGEPLTIDTIYKYDTQHMIAGEGFNASDAMHEIELLKGFGDTKGFSQLLGEYKTKYGSFIEEILESPKEIQNQIKDINNFQDVLNDLNNFSIDQGILANANMGDFSKIADLYKQAFIEAFADSDIDGAEVFERMFDDKGTSELRNRFLEVLNSSFAVLDSEGRGQAIEFFNSLSKDQAQAYIEAFNGAKNLDEVNQQYTHNLRALNARTYEAIINIEDETAAVNTLTSALSSSASGTGLSSEEITNITSLFSDLASYDEDALIERTANGIHLNVEELEKLNKERAEINLKKQGKELDKYNKELDESEKNLKDLKDRYDAGRMSLEEYQSAYAEETNIKNGILDKINLLEREMAQYSALTSAYNKYVQAQSSANENARYENIAGGYETTKDLIERGWIGQDDVRAYLNMFTNDDMMTASVQELYDVWDKLDDKINSAGYSAKDFFTFDKNNKSTSDGIFNFLDTVRQAAKDSGISDAILDQLVAVDEATGTYSFDFDILGGDQKIADMLGMDLSLLQAIIQAARDAGFEVQMTNALPGVQALTENLRNMRAEVKKLGGDTEKYDFDVLSVDVSDSSEYTSILDSISGAIKELKEANLDDPLNFAYYNQVNSELETLIGTKARATVDKGWEGTNIDQVAPKYQGLVAILDEMYYQQQRLKETNAFNEKYQLDVDTSNAQKAFDNVQNDLKKYVDNLSYADAQELGLNVTPKFDELTAEEKWETVREQIEEQGGVKIPVDLESPTGDPTKGIDSQKITIDVQFSVDGNTLVLKDITSVTKAAEDYPRELNTDLTVTGNGNEQVKDYNVNLDKVPTEVRTKLKAEEDKKLAPYKRALDKVPTSVKTQMLLTGTSALDNYLTKINNNKNKSIWVDIKARWDKGSIAGMPSSVANKLGGVWGTANVSGTAFVKGTAYAKGTSGDWGVPDDQDALVGELGEELIVRNGHFFTVGSESAEMVHLQRGDIIFNADQTRQIFEKGRIANGLRRGKAHADGTAYSAGSGGRRRTNAVVSSSNSGGGSSSGGGGNNKSSGNKSSNNEAEKMDWIAIAIERIEQQIDELNDVVDSVYRDWSDRNQALADEIKAVSDEIAIQQAGYKRYLKEAESIGLSEKYAKKVREGTIDIEKITDEKLKKKIDEYQQWCVLRPLIW